jgi:hypothetical protein
MIRGKVKNCPFGLPITDGCKSVGTSIFKMIPIEDGEEESSKEYNYRVYLADAEGGHEKCPFADLILEKKEAVECSFGEQINSSTSTNIPLEGSPIYPHLYVGNTTRSLQSYPLPYYSDDNIRTVYYGLISLLP